MNFNAILVRTKLIMLSNEFTSCSEQMNAPTAVIAVTMVHVLTSDQPASQGDNVSVMPVGMEQRVLNVRATTGVLDCY